MLERVSVDADGTWDESDVTLSEVSRILRVPGTYRIGVIDLSDADLDGDGQADATLTTSEFSSATSVQRGIRVTDQALDGQMVTYNGQVAVEDGTINVSGVAPGAEQVVVVFVGDRGSIVVNRDTVDDQDVFDNEDTVLSDADGTLEEGNVRGFIISPARDNVFGGEDQRSVNEFVSYVNGLEDRGLTQAQAIDLIRQASVEDEGSDDLLVETDFEFTDADTIINNVYPEGANASGLQPIALGETMTIEGVTNLRPDDNTIVLEMIRGPTAESFDVGIADDWGTDGQWSTSIPVPSDAEPGTYSLRADDGETITTVSVEIVEQREETATETGTPSEQTETPTESEETATEQTTSEPTPTPEPTPEPTTTETESPGFGLIIAVVALLAAALLAVRRR
jgi:major cell surface glycoprotein (TIGR04216 family)